KLLFNISHMHRNMSQACQGGCATCSEYNGCMSCKPRLFFFLKRSHMKQTGMCFSSCPPGYFGQRSPERNECMKCKADCECLENCPDWLEPNNHTMECNDIVHCKINEWSQWSPCTKNGKACGFKREMKQGSEKSYSFLQQRANYAHIQMKQEHVLYKKRIARKEEKVLKIIIKACQTGGPQTGYGPHRSHPPWFCKGKSIAIRHDMAMHADLTPLVYSIEIFLY
uniref:R-spondin 3 n=1 Tax=Naja naja TaxID=35670 RepID=A0A8C6VQS1_NAJNA